MEKRRDEKRVVTVFSEGRKSPDVANFGEKPETSPGQKVSFFDYLTTF